jgi:polyisoprenoid-binding protein YceI
MKSIGISGIAWALTLSISWAQAAPPGAYTIDPARSRVEVTVFKGGLLKVFGHDHVITAKSFSGRVRLDSENIEDSSVQLNIDAGSLVVLDDPGVSEKDRRQIEDNMKGAKGLDIREFPQVSFHSTNVIRAAKASGSLMLRGRLNLHGVEKELAFPVKVRLETDGLRVAGTVVVTQTDFGIKPMTGAAGGIRTKDRVNVKFEIFAEKAD